MRRVNRRIELELPVSQIHASFTDQLVPLTIASAAS